MPATIPDPDFERTIRKSFSQQSLMALLGAGALLTAVVPIVVSGDTKSPGAGLGIAAVRPLIASGFLSLLVVAWSASPAGPLSAVGLPGDSDPSLELAMGLALLTLVTAVVLRLGAIPGHAWVARYAEGMSTSAIPPLPLKTISPQLSANISRRNSTPLWHRQIR